MSACDRFKQNAWKKELCSNCYRPKEDHKQKPQLQNRPPRLPLKSPSQGILNIGSKNSSKKKKKSVRFMKEESEVIGYGGVESDDDDDDDDFGFEHSGDQVPTPEREVIGDEEKALERLTKTNTDFNSVLGNLNGFPEPPVQLGIRKKQTVQVKIQPFLSTSIATSRKSHLNKLLEDEEPKPALLSADEPNKGQNKIEIKKIEKIVTKEEEEEAKEPQGKKEERGNPEGRKTQITRGNVITKNHELVKNKLKAERRLNGVKDDEVSRIIIVGSVDEKNAKNLEPVPTPGEPELADKTTEEVTVNVLKLLNGENGPPESREMAGEPDGKADSDEPETPTISPPPRISFLHRDHLLAKQESPSDTRMKGSSPPALPSTPPPPPSSPPPQLILPPLHIHTSTQAHQPLQSPALSSPASDGLPALQELTITPVGSVRKRPAPKPPSPSLPPEPIPRRRSSTEPPPLPPPLSPEKKKTRVRLTLKKLLRFGGSRDEEGVYSKPSDETDTTPTEAVLVSPRPRLQIIHPLDLNKSGVQVLPPTDKSPESTSTSPIYSTVRPSKPPPPPRSESLNLMERLRPSPSSPPPGDNLYANLGEGRHGITPVKPQRTGSMRDAVQKTITIQNDSDHVYELVGVSTVPPPKIKNEEQIDADSDIYYPYVTIQNGEIKTTMKNRGIVHSSLEDNYSAVIVANLDALTVLLKKEAEKSVKLPESISGRTLAWEHFKVTSSVKFDSHCFIDAVVEGTEVTLVVTEDETLKTPIGFEVWGKFVDKVPSLYSPSNRATSCSVTIVKRLKCEKYLAFVGSLKKSPEGVRTGVMVLLDVLEFLEREDESVAPDNVIVCTPQDGESFASFIPTKTKGEHGRTHTAIFLASSFLDSDLQLARALSSVSDSLPLMISLLRTWLWGPTTTMTHSDLRRWLDLERAVALQSYIKERVDRRKLVFLVNADSQSISSANCLLRAANP